MDKLTLQKANELANEISKKESQLEALTDAYDVLVIFCLNDRELLRVKSQGDECAQVAAVYAEPIKTRLAVAREEFSAL